MAHYEIIDVELVEYDIPHETIKTKYGKDAYIIKNNTYICLVEGLVYMYK